MVRAVARSTIVVVAAFVGIVYLLTHALTSSARESTVYVVTPTYDRLTRFADLLQVGQALQLASLDTNVLWIVVEDSNELDRAVAHLLNELGVPHVYFSHQQTRAGPHRGVDQRNAALDLIKSRQQSGKPDAGGPVYFLDDDNAIRSRLVTSLAKLPRDTYTVFHVGNQGYFGLEGPVVDNVRKRGGDGKIVQWCCDLCRRRWNVDMAGFAFHSSLLLPSASASVKSLLSGRHIKFSQASEAGFLETDLLSAIEQSSQAQLVLSKTLLETVHVWHDSSAQFDKATYYDADWVTTGLFKLRPNTTNQVVRGFDWADDDLPSARWID
ncbi:hypothetical protein OIO90_005467 [Microbotryomycetes sp. JL221]|nr:hypothetical protein OIO90_005467 [Microbotryomycetes sp. JL221]